MPIKVTGEATAFHGNTTINLRCPVCRHEGAFHGFPGGIDESWSGRVAGPNGTMTTDGQYRIGYRQCPNTTCKAVLFFVQRQNDLVETFPAEVIDFDASNLPDKVLSSLEEATKCHAAGCYRAAALMVRKTLEELCADKQATGANLKAKIANLRTTIVISEDLLAAADELRLLGNDAAHVEAQAYDAIESEEVEVAIELTKELLKAVYQHTSLVARLRALKIPATP